MDMESIFNGVLFVGGCGAAWWLFLAMIRQLARAIRGQ